MDLQRIIQDTIERNGTQNAPKSRYVKPITFNDPLTALRKVGNTLFPSRRTLFEEKQQDAKQSLLPTEELARELSAEQRAFPLKSYSQSPRGPFQTSNFQEFLDATTLDIPDFAGLTKRVSSQVFDRLAKSVDRTEVGRILDEIGSKAKDLREYDIIVDTLVDEKNPVNVSAILRKVESDYYNKVAKEAPRRYSASNLPTPRAGEVVVTFTRNVDDFGREGVQWVSTDLRRAGEYGDIVEYGVVPRTALQPTGNIAKDTAGYRLIDNALADTLVRRNRIVTKQVPIREAGTGRFLGSFSDEVAFKSFPEDVQPLAQQAARYDSTEAFSQALRETAQRINAGQTVPSRLKPLAEAIQRTSERVVREVTRETGEFYRLIRSYRQQPYTPTWSKTLEDIRLQLGDIFGETPKITTKSTLTDRLGITDPNILGKATREGIELAVRFNSLDEAIATHEGWHWFIKNLTPDKQRELLALGEELVRVYPERAAALRADGYTGRELADEMLADEFARYHRTGKTLSEKMKAWFDRALQALTLLFNRKSQLIREFKNVKTTLQTKRGDVQSGPSFKREPRERGYVTSAKKVLPEAEKIKGEYIPRSTDELSIKARNLINDDPLKAEEIIREGTDENAVAIASEYLKKLADDAASATDPAVKDALYDKAAELANTMAPKLTELGRAVQAASILGRMTPEGQLKFAAKEIARYNETAKVKIPKLTGEQTAYIVDEMKAIQAMEDGIEKALRYSKLQEWIGTLVPTPVFSKLVTVWKAGLLTGIKTTGLNVGSNLFHTVSEVVKDIPASAVDSVASLFTGERTTVATLRGAFDGVKEGTIKGKRYFSTGFDERNIGQKLDYKRVSFGKGKVAKAFQTYTDTVFRVLGATDQPFYYAALSRSLMDQALANGKNLSLKGNELVEHAYKLVEDPTEEMMRYAVADATTAVFQNRTALGDVASAVQRLEIGEVPIGQIVLPFARTPSSVAMQIIAYSPVGAMAEVFKQVRRGTFDQRTFSKAVGRSITGTSLLALGYTLAEKGMVSLDYPIGDEREQELQKIEGQKANSILIDGKWRSPMVLGPAGNVILMGAHFQDALQSAGSPTEAASVAAAGVWKSFTEQTFLTGLNNFNNVLQDPKRYASSYLPNLAASTIPTLVSDVARATDPLERTRERGMTLDSFQEALQARIPFLRRQLNAEINVLGEERERVGNPLEVMLDPTRPSVSISTPVTDELRRLMNDGYRVSPTKLGDKNGFDVLTLEQNTELWKKAGELTDKKLTSLFAKPEYQQLPDDEKSAITKKIIKAAQDRARAQMVIDQTKNLSGTELTQQLSIFKEGGLLTRDVYNEYVKLLNNVQ